MRLGEQTVRLVQFDAQVVAAKVFILSAGLTLMGSEPQAQSSAEHIITINEPGVSKLHAEISESFLYCHTHTVAGTLTD